MNNAATLQNDATCNTAPPQNNSGLMCIPLVQKLSTTTSGGVNFLGIQFGGVPVSSCVWDFTMLGIALLALAFVILGMKRVKEAQAVGLAGVVLILLSVVVDNATLLALGGAGLALIAGVIIVAYLLLKFVVRI